MGGVGLRVPFISAPMDTVTGSRLGIAMALKGGLGVIHRNCTINDAENMLREVKDAEVPKKCDCAAVDSEGRLAVGAAVSPSDIERASALARFADVLFVDVASFHNTVLIDGTKEIIKQTGKKIVIGNFGTREGVLEAVQVLGAAKIAAIKVGMGGGSICKTTDVTGVGSPVPFAVEQAAAALEELGLIDKIPIIADGGIRESRDIAISLGLGASMVMLGNIFVASEESLAKIVKRKGIKYKVYWGMGSKEARKKRFALDRYQSRANGKDVDEGRKIYVRMDGKAGDLIDKFSSRLKVSMGYIGAKDIAEMRRVSEIVVRASKPSELMDEKLRR